MRDILKRAGVHRSVGIHPNDLSEAIRLYQSGWSLASVAPKFGVAPSTVNNALRQAGVDIRSLGRPRGAWSR